MLPELKGFSKIIAMDGAGVTSVRWTKYAEK
jgi:hypothetical protein